MGLLAWADPDRHALRNYSISMARVSPSRKLDCNSPRLEPAPFVERRLKSDRTRISTDFWRSTPDNVPAGYGNTRAPCPATLQ
jgi:hypothetical protein